MNNMVKYMPKELGYEMCQKSCEKKHSSSFSALNSKSKCLKVKNVIKARNSLRKEIKNVLTKNNRISNFQVKQVVFDFTRDVSKGYSLQVHDLQADSLKSDNLLKNEEEDELDLDIKTLFTCKCGWFLYNPSTLPCGHTTCKSCADKFMTCVVCGFNLTISSNISCFLEHILSVWFKKSYNCSKLKKQAIELYKNKEYLLALEKISLTKLDKDHQALYIKSKISTKLGHHEKALLDADMTCKLNSTLGKYYYRKGICFSNLKEMDNAIDAFQTCLEVDPLNDKLSNKVSVAIENLLCASSDSDNLNILQCYGNSKFSNCQSLFSLNKDNNQQKDNEKTFNKTNSESVFSFSKNEVKKNLQKNKMKFFNGVPCHLIKEEDFECKICYDIFLKPVTTPCGHVFCKNCLTQTMDHNPCCPICRLSLVEYQSSSMTETFIIEQILEQFFKESYEEKLNQRKERMERLSRVGIDEDVEVPLFICAIAFPYVPYRLHIFEPKYRLMIRECLESKSKKFGMCIPNNNGEISDVGTICEIMNYKVFPDGRFMIEAVATQRFLILNKQFINSMYYGRVTYFKDDVADVDSAMLAVISRSVYEKLLNYFSSLKQEEQQVILNTIGPHPEYSSDFELSQHGIPWVWWGLAMVPVNQTAKLLLLQSTSVIERILSLQRFLKFLSKVSLQNPQNQ
ncbi:LON peptidase N-terminal domain and RING finger protein 3 [Hydra vulgaris]|uniref:LON peptidase N-terminal domain and RING finger protein 3 n=1 Tax=Hydra vulgaris TaxID=6087 RepID=A0ABM4D2M0_HYDVU